MTRIHFWLATSLVLGFVLAPRPAAAQVDSFSDRQAFLSAAVNPLATRDFEELPDAQEYQTYSYGDISFRSVESTPADLKVFGPDSLPLPQVASKTLFSNWNYQPLVVEFSPAVSAFGADLVTVIEGTGAVVTVEATDGTHSFTVDFASTGGPQFFGVIARSGSITRVTVSNPLDQQQYLGLDNVTYGQAKQAPQGGNIDDCLQQLLASIRAGRADRTILRVGPSLEAKVRAAQVAVRFHRARAAARALANLSHQVSEQRGRRIAASRADELLGLIQQGQALLQPH